MKSAKQKLQRGRANYKKIARAVKNDAKIEMRKVDSRLFQKSARNMRHQHNNRHEEMKST